MKILVVEDEERLRDALLESLRMEGYLADGTGDGESGLDMIRSGLYDLVLLDIMLPRLSGIDVLSIARKLKINVPIILLTAMSQLENKIEGMDSGADDYITKPFEMKELFARIRMVARRGAGSDSYKENHVSCGDLTLDTGSHSLKCAVSGKSIPLAGKEYHMLEYFMRNPDQVLSRDQITLRVWGYESEAEYNNVDVYISYLRKKLLFLKTESRIAAVRGVGYRLVSEGGDEK